jgi:hypothetical protein
MYRSTGAWNKRVDEEPVKTVILVFKGIFNVDYSGIPDCDLFSELPVLLETSPVPDCKLSFV